MNQIFIGIILILGIGGYFLYQENVTLKANNLALEVAVAEQKEAFEIMKANFELQGNALRDQQNRNAQIEAEKAEYLSIFARHNLDSLALAKPGMVETRINKASDAVLEGLENDTKAIYELDSTNIPD
tara:strand:- start:2866 stop:3249 length:384 start_codon:yes stop_codon:yes gene_type:complete